MRFAPALRFFRRQPAAGYEQDPADLGTAFGMEASLEGGFEEEFRPSGGYELESAERAADRTPAPQTESPLAWLSRRN